MSEPVQQGADMLARLGRHWGWVLSFGIITLLAGIVVLAWPGASLLTLSIVLGIWLLIYGVMEITAAFRLRRLAHSASRHLAHAH